MGSEKGSDTVIWKSEDRRLLVSGSEEGTVVALVSVCKGGEGSSLVKGMGKAGGKVGLSSDIASLEIELRDRDRASKGRIMDV